MRVDRLFRPLFDEVYRYGRYGNFPIADLESLQDNGKLFLEALQQYNLLSILRTFPIGIFSLMSWSMPSQTPVGAPSEIHVNSIFALLGWILLLTLVGWVCGGLFFRWVSLVVTDSSGKDTQSHFGFSVVQTMLISILYLILVVTLGTPVVIVLGLAVAANPVLAQVMFLIFGLLSMWVVVPLFFTPHGIFLRQQNAFLSIYDSLRMARFTLPTSSLFVLSVLLIAFGLNILWNIPSSDSWMALVGIAGHAFVSTSLLAASFIYYRELKTWLQTVLEKLKANIPAQQA